MLYTQIYKNMYMGVPKQMSSLSASRSKEPSR